MNESNSLSNGGNDSTETDDIRRRFNFLSTLVRTKMNKREEAQEEMLEDVEELRETVQKLVVTLVNSIGIDPMDVISKNHPQGKCSKPCEYYQCYEEGQGDLTSATTALNLSAGIFGQCDDSFNSLSELETKPHCSTVCAAFAAGEDDIEKRRKVKIKRNLQLDPSNSSLSNQNRLSARVRGISLSVWKCALCGEEFSSQEALKAHRYIVKELSRVYPNQEELRTPTALKRRLIPPPPVGSWGLDTER